MHTPLLTTKLFAPPPQRRSVERQQLLQRLDEGLQGKLTLVCAPAGFGKSTVLGAWAQKCELPSAWLSLDEGERDPDQFAAYLTASLRSVSADMGDGALAVAQARPRPPPLKVLTHLINHLARRRQRLVLVLDDYQLASSAEVDGLLAFLIDKLPPSVHLVVVSREVPALPLARLRAHGQVQDIGQQDLRFTADETRLFLNESMALGLTESQLHDLDARTEGWPAGLHMAAAMLAKHSDADAFIGSFTGSHRLVQDYLLEEVLQRLPAQMQSFLLRTSVLGSLCAELCVAVTQTESARVSLNTLDASDLFVVALDDERRWFRYQHLFGAMLLHRLRETEDPAPLHLRACAWYESQGMVRQALHHAVAAGEPLRAAQVVQGRGMPLYFLEDAEPVLQWLQDQSPAYLDAHPPLWLMLTWSYLATSQHSRMRAPIVGAEAAIEAAADHPAYRAWRGEWHAVRAWEAVALCDPAAIEREAGLALEWLPQDQLAVRVTAQCALGVAHQFSGANAEAQRVYREVLPVAESCGNRMFTIVACIALGHLQEDDNKLHLAARTYGRALQVLGDQPHLVACEVHLGLARIHYQWNDLAAASMHAEKSSRLAALLECDSALGADALRAQLLLCRGKTDAALTLLAQASAAAQTRNEQGGRPAIAQAQVQALLQTGEVMAAGQIAQSQSLQNLPLAHAWVLLARGQALQAHESISAFLQAARGTAPATVVLRALLLQALALDAYDPGDAALNVLEAAMALAEPQGCVRVFVDLGGPMQRLLDKVRHGTRPRYTALLLEAMQQQLQTLAPAAPEAEPANQPATDTPGLLDPLSQREMQILTLICKGLSNQEIGQQIFVSLSTVKWHNQNIFDKLAVQRRTEAVARARELKLL